MSDNYNEEEIITDDVMQQKPEKKTLGLFAAESRGGLLIGIVILAVFAIVGGLGYLFLSNEAPKKVSAGAIKADSIVAEAGAKTHEAYKEAKRIENDNRYKSAASRDGGVAMPFIFDDEEDEGVAGDIETCGCTLDDEQLIRAMQRLGLTGLQAGVDNMRVARSDVYVASDGRLMGGNGEPLQYKGQAIYMQSNGVLSDVNGNEYKTPSDITMYIGKQGEIIDATTRRVALRGDLMTSDGIIIMNDGKAANKGGNSTQVADSDIYITRDRQLITLDGRPVLSSGAIVFKDDEQLLVNKGDLAIAWEGRSVYQNNAGHLVDSRDNQFEREGILFTYSGILIDNSGKLTKPLADIKRVGLSDLYLAQSGRLVDSSASPITHYGREVLLSRNKLHLAGGGNVQNRDKADLFLNEEGRITADVGKGAVQSGVLKASNGVAFDRSGELLSRRGRIERRGSSIFFTSSDGLLVDNEGRTILFKNKDTFLDWNAMLPDGSHALMTWDYEKVLSKDRYRVYLTPDGRLVDANGNAIEDTGMLVTADGVAITSDGKTVLSEGLKRLTNESGMMLSADGREIFVDENGRLVDEFGNPILGADGQALFLDENGNIVDEFGRIVTDTGIQIKSDSEDFTGLQVGTDGVLRTKDGKALMVDGKPVKVGKDGSLLGADGKPILTKDGRKVFVDEFGNLVDEHGNPVDPSEIGMTESLGAKVAADGTLLSADGKALLVDGKPVSVAADGSLLGADGKPIMTKDGRKVFVDEFGNLVDEFGNPVDPDEIGMTTGEQSKFKVTSDGSVLRADGSPLLVKGQKVSVAQDGSLLGADGKPLLTKDGRRIFIDKDGNMVDQFGNIIREDEIADTGGISSGLKAVAESESMKRLGSGNIHISKDGLLLDKDGKPLTYNGQKVRMLPDGRLVDEHGRVITDKYGNAVYMDKDGNLVDKDGRRINDSLLRDGSGVLLDASGKDAIDGARQLGSSDVFMARDGKLLGADGKPILYDGKEVFVGEDGQLYYADGRPVKDEFGNSVFVDPNTGAFVDKDGKPSKGLKLTNSDGVLLGADGQLITSGGKLTKIEGTNYFRTADGLIVDEFGRPVSNYRIDSEGRIVNQYGTPIRFKGREMYLNADGNLIDAAGNVLKDENEGALTVTGDGIANQEGQAVNLTTGQVDLEGSQEEAVTGPVFESLVDRDRSAARAGEVAPPATAAEDRQATQRGTPDSTASSADPTSGDAADKEEAITLDEDAIGRLTRRYQNLKNQMTRQLNAAIESENREAQGGMFSVSGEVSSGMGALELAEYEGNLEYELAKITKKYEGLTSALEPEEGVIDGSIGDYIYAKAGDTLYGITINAINSDASSTKVVAELVGVPMTSPLFGARVLGDFVFDDKGPWVGWVEVIFDQLCLRNQDECLDIEGMGIEPSDSSPLLSHKVNRHYWYRFSGLFLASMLEGTAEAMSEAGNRETENVGGNQTVIVTGLNGKKLALRSVGKIGERFADVFAQQVARPSTVRIKAGVELGIMLTKHVKGPAPTDDMSIFSDF